MVIYLKTFAHKVCKIAEARKVSYIFFYLFTPFKGFLPPLTEVQCPNFLDIRNLGDGKKCYQIVKLLLLKGMNKIATQIKASFWEILPY